jgi:hypothetical protein
MLRRNVPCGHCVLTINKCEDFDSNGRGQIKPPSCNVPKSGFVKMQGQRWLSRCSREATGPKTDVSALDWHHKHGVQTGPWAHPH